MRANGEGVSATGCRLPLHRPNDQMTVRPVVPKVGRPQTTTENSTMTLNRIATAICASIVLSAASMSSYAADAYARPMPSNPIVAGPTTLGSIQPVVTVPLVAQARDAILKEAETVKALNPDMVEVRADYWDCIENPDEALKMLRDIRGIMKETPILLTVRIKAERGFKDVSEKAKFDFYTAAVKEKLPNFIDVELAYGQEKIQAFKKTLEGSGISLVVAYHDLNATPSKEEIVKLMESEIAAGGDVAKIVVKPNSEEDVLTFLGGTLAFRRAHPEFPIIASGSGDTGRVTRLIGGLFGIDLTFASGVKGSNATQMPVSTMRMTNDIIYPAQK